jgi:uncharacterized protein
MIATYRWADHRVFPRPEGAVVFGVDDASLFLLPDEARDVLARWRGREPLAMDEAPPADREVLEALRDARLLVPAELRSRRRPVPPDPEGAPLATLVLQVAQDCNLRCGYCYASGGTYGHEARLMTPDSARKAVRRLVASSGDLEEVTLVLFGGEPLLNRPALEAAVEEIEAVAHEAGKAVNLSLTTNGTLLDAATVAFLHTHHIGVSVSLDGPPDLHDANRPYADGAGSYASVVRGLRLLLDGSPRPVAARVTLTPAQWDRVPEVFEHLLGLGFHEVGIAPASPATDDLLPSKREEDALLRGFETLARRFEEEARQGRVLPFSNLLDLLGRLHAGQVRSLPCGAGFGYLAVDASERLYLCHRLAGEAAFCVGDLDRGPDAVRTRGCLESLAEPRREECSRCWARTLCSGGCHYENHVRENVLGQAPGGTCRFVRRWLALGIGLYGRLGEGDAEWLLSRLSRRAAH